jgi:hypothetical protein
VMSCCMVSGVVVPAGVLNDVLGEAWPMHRGEVGCAWGGGQDPLPWCPMGGKGRTNGRVIMLVVLIALGLCPWCSGTNAKGRSVAGSQLLRLYARARRLTPSMVVSRRP